ncbi:MAG: GAF domain-containing protein [Planctomycetota bacterium]
MAGASNQADPASAVNGRRDLADRLSRLAAAAVSGVLVYECDTEGVLRYASDGASAVLGVEPSDAVGKSWGELATAAAGVDLQDCFGYGPNASPSTHTASVRGAGRVMTVSAQPIRDDDGHVVGGEGLCSLASETPSGESDTTAELRRRLAFENLLISLSTGFINLPVEEIDAGMRDAIRRIGEFTGVDRCFIYSFDEAEEFADLTHEWVAPGVPSVQQQMQRVPVAKFAWEKRWLMSDRTLHVPDVERLPPQAAALRENLTSLGVRSTVLTAMMSGEKLIGMLGFVSTRDAKAWSDEDIDLVQVLAQVLVNTLGRLRAEQSVRESESRYRAIVEDQTDLIVRWRPDGVQTFVNDSVCRLLDRPADDILGANVFDGIHPDDVQQVRDKLASLTPERPFAADEHRAMRPDGTLLWMQWIDRAMFDEQGRAVEYQSIGRDITELRRAQEALRSKLEFERLVLDISLRFINLPATDIEQGIGEALRRIGEFTGVECCYVYRFDDEQAAEAAHHWSAPGAPRWIETWDRLAPNEHNWVVDPLLAGEPLHVPSLEQLPPGAAGQMDRLGSSGVKSFVNVPMRADHRVVGYLGAAVFSEPKQWSDDELSLMKLTAGVLVNFLLREGAERDLRFSEERLRLTIESVEGGLFDLNVESGQLFLSDRLQATYGLPAGVGDYSLDVWIEAIDTRDRPQVRRSLQAHLTDAEEFFDVEFRVPTTGDETAWRHARGRVVERTPAGNPVRMLGVDRDVTWRVREQQKTRELEGQLAHLGRVATMGETVTGLAHEVNQPLHAAATFCAAAGRALTSGRDDAAQRTGELTKKTGEQIARAGDIIHRLRDFTRPQPATMTLLNVSDVARESAALVSHLATRRDVRVELELAEGLPQVEGDLVQLQQVVVNLIQNAYDSLESGAMSDPVVRLSTFAIEDNGGVVISVADNGPECKLDDLEEMFEAFFTTKSQGMGIGLTLCRSIVRTHQGHINAERSPGGGVAFHVTLPAADALKRSRSGARLDPDTLAARTRPTRPLTAAANHPPGDPATQPASSDPGDTPS